MSDVESALSSTGDTAARSGLGSFVSGRWSVLRVGPLSVLLLAFALLVGLADPSVAPSTPSVASGAVVVPVALVSPLPAGVTPGPGGDGGDPAPHPKAPGPSGDSGSSGGAPPPKPSSPSPGASGPSGGAPATHAPAPAAPTGGAPQTHAPAAPTGGAPQTHAPAAPPTGGAPATPAPAAPVGGAPATPALAAPAAAPNTGAGPAAPTGPGPTHPPVPGAPATPAAAPPAAARPGAPVAPNAAQPAGAARRPGVPADTAATCPAGGAACPAGPQPVTPAPGSTGSPTQLDAAQQGLMCGTTGTQCPGHKPGANDGGTGLQDTGAATPGWKDAGHAVLDGAGMVPGVQEVANGINAIWYAADGDWVNAGISAAGMIPVAGDAAVGARLAAKGAKLLKGADNVEKAQKVVETGEETGKKLRPDFIADKNGTVVPTSKSRLEDGFQRAGFPQAPTRSPGTDYTLPDGSHARVMDPSGPAPSRASFTNSHEKAVSPFTGKPVQPPPGMSKPERKEYIRSRTHVELGP